ncbi:MAG TPA: hypothetical protein VFI44_12060 [Ornithinibacter sp.]|nr:hypothetical protein [Ornithinibacter sp.]
MSAVLRGLVTGLGLGLAWGVVARVFMRLLTTDPSFSWSGTLFILGVGGVAGAGVGLVHAARVAGRSPWWRLAALPALALFAGPGMALAPAAVGMAMVLRGGWVVRVLGAVAVTGSPLIVVVSAQTVGATPTQLAGVALMVLSAVPLGWGIAEVVCRWRPRPPAATEATVDPAVPRGSVVHV